MMEVNDRVVLRVTHAQRLEHAAQMRDGMCSNPRGCWQEVCYIARRFSNGRYLIKNRTGYVRACDEEEIYSY